VVSPRLIALTAACALACIAPASAIASSHSYYLALGDSLARGAQPNAAGQTVPTNQGYADLLFAAEKRHIQGLRLKKLGCLGETTATMMHGGICHYSAGNQLAAAVQFMHRHRIAFITLDIGANDVDGCLTATLQINASCLNAGLTAIGTNAPQIVGALRKAAGRKAKIAAMTYYDPFLALYLTGATGQVLASASVPLAQQVNNELSAAFHTGHLRIAGVARAFDTYTPFATTTNVTALGTVPLAVAKICELTWMCAAAPRGPNIHADAAGYRKIAAAFKRALS
jgi:lysophospholipase L1-like esterase